MNNVPNTRRFAVIRSGTMNLMSDKPFWWVVPSMFFIVLGIVAAILLAKTFMLLGLFVGLLVGLPAEFMFISARTGRACRYTADEEKLTVFRHNKTEEFYYSETTGVTFKPFSMVSGFDLFECGYKVIIHTKYKDIVRYYAFGGSHGKNPPQDTPFWILVLNMPGEKEKDQDILSGDEYYANETKEEP